MGFYSLLNLVGFSLKLYSAVDYCASIILYVIYRAGFPVVLLVGCLFINQEPLVGAGSTCAFFVVVLVYSRCATSLSLVFAVFGFGVGFRRFRST